jgi:hypothetical protein
MGYEHSLCFKEFLDQLILLYFRYVYIYNKSKIMYTRANNSHYGLRPLSEPEKYT